MQSQVVVELWTELVQEQGKLDTMVGWANWLVLSVELLEELNLEVDRV